MTKRAANPRGTRVPPKPATPENQLDLSVDQQLDFASDAQLSLPDEGLQAEVKSNLALWNQVKDTNASDTLQSDYDKNGMGRTIIKTSAAFRKATEAFGPCGVGWGWTVLERTMDPGAIAYEDGNIIGQEIINTLKVEFWFLWDGAKRTIVEYGHTYFVRRTRYGYTTEENPDKKSLTDAIKKSLTTLGFFADIYEGEFDNEQRLQEKIKIEQDERNAQLEKERIEALSKLQESIKGTKIAFEEAKTAKAIETAFTEVVRLLNNALTKKFITHDEYNSQLSALSVLRTHCKANLADARKAAKAAKDDQQNTGEA